ncbi:MAG: hypothetical protein RI553_05950, partial [Salibaculum sp.]|nr:hypothetical protein [Salibaculum sp.]
PLPNDVKKASGHKIPHSLLHTEHDADGNGALSSDEFATLFAEVTRGMAERPFTMLDADDDGEISAEEMAFPAQMMARMQRMHGTDTDQQ